ncbi:hypothetical protein AEB_P2678 [Altererythrobacter sp. B11]|nr:hypothetical protein AEB_P2678 [Altererythrobacter sp. B11]
MPHDTPGCLGTSRERLDVADMSGMETAGKKDLDRFTKYLVGIVAENLFSCAVEKQDVSAFVCADDTIANQRKNIRS